jgi:deoxycytidylate deaminase
MIAQSGIKKVYYRTEYRIGDGINVLRKLGVEVEKM